MTLPWESPQEFAELHDGLRSELLPDGTMEEEIVFDIARYRWLKRRVHRAIQLASYRSALSRALAKCGTRDLGEIQKYLEKRAKKQSTTVAEAEAKLSRMNRNIKQSSSSARATSVSSGKN